MSEVTDHIVDINEMVTDNTQEIDEILSDLDLRVDSGQAYIYDTDEAIERILDWHKRQVEEVLDRIESKGLKEDGGSRFELESLDGYVAATAWNDAQDKVERAIRAERNKLNEER